MRLNRRPQTRGIPTLRDNAYVVLKREHTRRTRTKNRLIVGENQTSHPEHS